MIGRRLWLTAAIGAASVAVPGAQPAPTFRAERPIVVEGAGPRRLAIDIPLLAGGAPFKVQSRYTDPETGETTVFLADGLRDLRLYGASGLEVGYLFVRNPPAPPRFKGGAILPIAPVETDKTRLSGFETDLGDAMLVDGLRLDGLSAPFLKRVRLEGSGDRAHWTLLVNEGTVFDLPQEQLRLNELRFPPGPYRFLRVTFDDTNSARLPFPAAANARLVTGVVPAPVLKAPLTVERRTSEPGRSRFRIRLPAAHLPVVGLDLDIGGEYVFRQARVFEARFSGTELVPVQLGATTLRRIVRGDIAATALRLPIDPPSEPQLDLEVDDGDNPPLDLRGVNAVFGELPWIYFEAASAGTLTAQYGNDTLTAPRYDLEAARNQVRIETVADAKWGEPRPRTAAENAAAAAAVPLPTLGAPLDASLFKYLRDVPSGGAGLIAVPLDAAVLAHSAGSTRGFADLRVIDASGNQIPYVLERVPEPLTLELSPDKLSTPPPTLTARRTGASPQSIYRIKYPFADLPATTLSVSTETRVFDRGITVAVERPPSDRRRDPWLETIASTRWVHADQDRPAPPLSLQVPALRATDLLLIVDEGDNTPLPLGKAHVMLPATRVRLYREQGMAIRLAYGRTDLSQPRYDLALLRPQVLGTAAQEVTPGPERQGAGAVAAVALVSPKAFWGVLGLSVAVLVVLIVRLLRKP